MPQNNHTPLIPPATQLPEITIKAVILALILTVLLGAADAYLALKVGNTVSASIPAAVISMAVFRFFKKSNVLENNLVQTAASAGEGLAGLMTFILPALIIVKFWFHFPFWQVVFIVIIGGILGVLFAVPLRRILLSLKNLPFPEGTAIGNVLKASAKRADIRNLFRGSLVGGVIVLMQTGFKILADHLPLWFKSDSTLFGISLGFNPALMGAGYIIGPVPGFALFVGTTLCWIFGVPILSLIYGIPLGAVGTEDMVMGLWNQHIRYIGVGTMLVAGAWTLLTLIKPITTGLLVSFRAVTLKNSTERPIILRTEKDLPFKVVFWGVTAMLLFAFGVVNYVLYSSNLDLSHGFILGISLLTVSCILLLGFLSAIIAGYIVGLIGSTNAPISGILIINAVLLSLILLPLFGTRVNLSLHMYSESVIAIIVLILAIIGGATVITDENIQDLKAGQMVGATPWKQQLMMLIGVLAVSFIIPPVLNLLFQAYGMGGVFPHAGMDPSQMLPAPQAGLIAALLQGAVGHSLPWPMLITGGIIALFCIGADEFLKTKGMRLPVLAVGLGIYLPPEVITPTLAGGLICYFARRTLQNRAAHLPPSERPEAIAAKQESSILLACGLVAGAALMGVILAIPFVIKGNSDALKLVSDAFIPYAKFLGLIVTIWVGVWMYRAGAFLKK